MYGSALLQHRPASSLPLARGSARAAAARARVVALAPGLAACLVVTLAALAVQALELRLGGRAWLEALVLAIVLGALARTAWRPSARFQPGIAFGAKPVLELAVVLLGATVSARAILAAGPGLLGGIAVVVVGAIGASYGLCRVLGLPRRMAALVACGNSICGNSAIAAVAPVIGAEGCDVAAAIAFTAVLGVAVVLGLPLAGALLHLDALQYGALAGLTVYAVPQVLAAAAPFGSAAVQMGTLVKLVRVLMLGPVCVALSLMTRRGGGAAARPSLVRLTPWFIVGFLLLVAARSAGLVPPAAVAPIQRLAGLLTVVSMAALGLGTDLKAVAAAGMRVSAAVSLSLLGLGAISLGLIRLLHLA